MFVLPRGNARVVVISHTEYVLWNSGKAKYQNFIHKDIYNNFNSGNLFQNILFS